MPAESQWKNAIFAGELGTGGYVGGKGWQTKLALPLAYIAAEPVVILSVEVKVDRISDGAQP
jgi:hypothetical protein